MRRPEIPAISAFDSLKDDGEPWVQDGDPTQEVEDDDIVGEEIVHLGAGGAPLPAPDGSPRRSDDSVASRPARLPPPVGPGPRARAAVEPVTAATAAATASAVEPVTVATEPAAGGRSPLELGLALREQGQLQRAIEELNRALGRGSREVRCHTLIGLCYLDLGIAARAISSFKDALFQEDVTAQEATALHYELGRAHERQERWEESLHHYRRVVKADPTFRDAAIRIAQIRRLGEIALMSNTLRTTDRPR